MPHHAGPAVTGRGVADGVGGAGDREVLVGFGDPLHALGGHEVDEGLHEREEPGLCEEPVQRKRLTRLGQAVALQRLHAGAELVGVPRSEVLVRREGRAVLGGYPVGEEDHCVVPERGRELLGVPADLGVRGLKGGVLVAGPFQLDDGERQAVDVEDEVEATVTLAVDDGDLADSAIGVGVRFVEVDDTDRRVVLGSEGVDVGDGADAADKEAVRGSVLLVRVLRGRRCGGRDGVAYGVGGEGGVQSLDRLAEVGVEDQVGPGRAVPGTGGKLVPFGLRPVELQ